MNSKLFFGAATLFLFASSANAAPLWHSVVLDDYSSPLVEFGLFDNQASASMDNADAILGNPGITSRRDMSLARQSTNESGFNIASTVTVDGGQLSFADNPQPGGSTSIPLVGQSSFVTQNDYGTVMSGADAYTGVVTGAVIADYDYSKFVVDVSSITGTFDLAFTVFGANVDGTSTVGVDNDFAVAVKTVSSTGLVEFDRSDFTKSGDFATDAGPKFWRNWADVTSFAIMGTTTGLGSTITFNETYATIPEPSSMLALAGLFGGAGIAGLRRKRKMKEAVAA